jgi:hypothetical protein
MAVNRRIPLTPVARPGLRHVMRAPPVLIASNHTIDYTCGHCGIILMHADDGQVHNLMIFCACCGSYNSTDGLP